jgi:4a-hydroxytetrahydrobiopterin dehydratase
VKPLSKLEVRTAMGTLPGWSRRGSIIKRTYSFKDFAGALRFVNKVGRAAEKANHHPDIDIRWNRVILALTTHEAGGLTTKDFEMAAKANQLAGGE